ncbi:MAG: GNAT family N-acetyltransferase [Planctomycetes bacterium]|nr:GNAT family N-acetyltransferase [Planctomycetota bacterium]
MNGRPWTPRDADERDLADQRRLFNACFRKDKGEDTFRWKYLDNPHGRALSLVACASDGRVVGGYSYVPRRFLRDGEPVVLMQASDAMVDASARRQGIFTGLDDLVAERAGARGVPLAFAYSGRLSYDGFLKNGWRLLGHARIVRYRFRARRGLLRRGRLGPLLAVGAPLLDALWTRRDDRRWRAHGHDVAALTRVQRFDASFDDLFAAAAPRRGLVGVRDAAWMNWRYVDTPTRRAECYALRSPDGTRMDACLVLELVDGHGYVVDHLARDEAVRERLLTAATAFLHARGAEEATALLCEHHPSAPVLERLGWAASRGDLPFRDVFPFIVRVCRDDADPSDLDLRRWHLADGDRDAEHMSP